MYIARPLYPSTIPPPILMPPSHISTSPRCLQTCLTTLFSFLLPCLTHSRPSSPALQALNPALISLFLIPSPYSPTSFNPIFLSLHPVYQFVSPPVFTPLLLSTNHIPWVCTLLLGWWGGGYRCQCFDPVKDDIQLQSYRSRHWAPWHLNDKALCKTSVRGPFPYSLPAENIKSRQVEPAGIELSIPGMLYEELHRNQGNTQLDGVDLIAFKHPCQY